MPPSPTPTVRITPERDPALGRVWVLRAEQVLDHPLERVFPFFADAHNLEAITPAFLRFHVLTPRPIDMRPGLLLDYRRVALTRATDPVFGVSGSCSAKTH